jgi:hypothetical protein
MTISKNALLSTCLFASLVGNLALGGMVIGKRYAHHVEAPTALRTIIRYVKTLPADQQASLASVIDPAQVDIKTKYKALRHQRERIARLLIAPQIDRPQVDDAFAAYRSMVTDMQIASQKAILATALALPQADRERMIDQVGRRRAKDEEAAERSDHATPGDAK